MAEIEISAKEFNKSKTGIEESLRESVQCLMMSPNVSITEACDDSKIDEEDYFPLETIEELKNFEKKLRDFPQKPCKYSDDTRKVFAGEKTKTHFSTSLNCFCVENR